MSVSDELKLIRKVKSFLLCCFVLKLFKPTGNRVNQRSSVEDTAGFCEAIGDHEETGACTACKDAVAISDSNNNNDKHDSTTSNATSNISDRSDHGSKETKRCCRDKGRFGSFA